MSTPPKKRAAEPAPIVVVRKVVHRGGHYGGAWKVAYADFVTTMMALFIVLWAAGQDTNVRESIATYFRNPDAVRVAPIGGRGSSVLPTNSGGAGHAEAAPRGAAGTEGDEQALEHAADSIRLAIESVGDLKELSRQIRIDVNPEGLRVQFVEFDDSLFFEVGSARLKPTLTRLLAIVGETVGKLPNGVIVEGHTDERAYAREGSGYTNWELSADRANSARRVLEASGIDPRHVVRVIGYADREPLVPDNRLDPTNRRVSVIVKRRAPASTPTTTPAPAPTSPGRDGADRLRQLLSHAPSVAAGRAVTTA
jgi:chemotaxis protein MotB